jgi:hypothetical protein
VKALEAASATDRRIAVIDLAAGDGVAHRGDQSRPIALRRRRNARMGPEIPSAHGHDARTASPTRGGRLRPARRGSRPIRREFGAERGMKSGAGTLT